MHTTGKTTIPVTLNNNGIIFGINNEMNNKIAQDVFNS